MENENEKLAKQYGGTKQKELKKALDIMDIPEEKKTKKQKEFIDNLFEEGIGYKKGKAETYFTLKEVLKVIDKIKPNHPYIDGVKLFIRQLKREFKSKK